MPEHLKGMYEHLWERYQHFSESFGGASSILHKDIFYASFNITQIGLSVPAAYISSAEGGKYQHDTEVTLVALQVVHRRPNIALVSFVYMISCYFD